MSEETQDQATARRKSNRAAKGKGGNAPAKPEAQGQVETKTKDGRHRRQLPSGAVAIV